MRTPTYSIILIAEDDFHSRLLLKNILTLNGATVCEVDDGDAAIDAVQTRAYDVILMDIQMPGKDGIQATQVLRLKGYSGVIIAITAHALPEYRALSLSAGCNGYLTKPITLDLLIAEITRLAAR